MKVTLTMNGKSVELDLTSEQMKALSLPVEKPTGYYVFDRDADKEAYFVTSFGDTCKCGMVRTDYDKLRCDAGNLYTDETVARNNGRADMLFRNLRKFAAEHGGCVSPDDCLGRYTFEIAYHVATGLEVRTTGTSYAFVNPAVFKSELAALSALSTFKDELLWYFTEYDPMAPGFWGDSSKEDVS